MTGSNPVDRGPIPLGRVKNEQTSNLIKGIRLPFSNIYL
jgi:hypothetical protein